MLVRNSLTILNYSISKIYSDGQHLVVTDANVGEVISIYTKEAVLVKILRVTADRMNISLPPSNIYLVKLSGRIVKVVM